MAKKFLLSFTTLLLPFGLLIGVTFSTPTGISTHDLDWLGSDSGRFADHWKPIQFNSLVPDAEKRNVRPSAPKGAIDFEGLAARLNRLRKKYFPRSSLTAAAKADSENKPLTAAVNRCATQNQAQPRVFPQPASVLLMG